VLAGSLQHYKEIQVNTASGVSLIIVALDAGLKHLGAAREAMKAGRARDAAKSLEKVYGLLGELSGSLNFEAGEIAVRLFSLYEFCGRQIAEASARKDPAGLEVVRDILLTLRQAWVECHRNGAGRRFEPPRGFEVVVG
jgi:flagellar protein FliS